MSLINCAECGHQISDKAESCPNCGNPQKAIGTLSQGTVCKYCKKNINPVVTNVGGGSCSVGSRERWTCPSCKRVIFSKGCFIATAAYSNEDYAEVQLLREFRDEYLQSSKLGIYFVKFYYKISPYIAYLSEKNPYLKRVFRLILDRIVQIIEKKTPLRKDRFKN
ncbi:CFI-box-CTERM domain-containing protein [Legionella pneumophila serogroup 1]|uniref:CFI-box-CTERM domain-containing protein n=1 Tax=Legionella pneumophila TaxID=446 RepID=UPI000770B642|nr:CFI-box-CTERM domain-containing protein [Legionella pneumophila]HAT8822843.1 zinc ribbon domain-containing protein [Legionella pneumophila subsp. pneumophila]MCZ4737311.1 zinc ribbon domain-containing protein [Legionella pneumophila]MCZ4746130.1 zinc ribbon domain-containing protein [Legionella pneumophila]MDI9829172.1 zinc ribbon domain-containing protein [Legionella pneumophila]MDO5159263.1 zinc ribbon domain-containing protein [Legionella pneumophila]